MMISELRDARRVSAFAIVGIAYIGQRVSITMEKEMQELGTAAIHLLTMRTSSMRVQQE